VADEAQTMRWLFVLRLGGTVLTGVIGFVVAVGAGALSAGDGRHYDVLTVALPVVLGLVVLFPTLEMQAMRRYEPVRWAARRLAILAVQADPDQGEAGDEAWRELQRLVAESAGYDHPRSALRHIAHVMTRPKPRPARMDDGGALSLNQTNLNVITLVAFIIALCALIMTAVLKFS
jgi:uncharacterized membrane protein YhaH (DUF805 family)